MMVAQNPENVMLSYAEAYENDWVIVNGARMRLAELEHLTKQLQMEYKQTLSNRKNMVGRLIKWFKG
jgi:hypothetical protein